MFSEFPDYRIIKSDNLYLRNNQLYKIWDIDSHVYVYIDNTHNDSLIEINKYKFDLYNINNYFPGKYFQLINSRLEQKSITNIVVDKYTNFGWGLFSEYIYTNKGYGEDDNSFYTLAHLDNILNLIIKNMIFHNYYIEEKDKDEIINEIANLTIYNESEIKFMFLELIEDPLEINFTIIGYFKLKEMYNRFIRDNASRKNQFYDILLHNVYLSPDFIEKFRLSNFYE